MSVPKPSPLIQESNFSTMARPKKVSIKAWKVKTEKERERAREKQKDGGEVFCINAEEIERLTV